MLYSLGSRSTCAARGRQLASITIVALPVLVEAAHALTVHMGVVPARGADSNASLARGPVHSIVVDATGEVNEVRLEERRVRKADTRRIAVSAVGAIGDDADVADLVYREPSAAESKRSSHHSKAEPLGSCKAVFETYQCKEEKGGRVPGNLTCNMQCTGSKTLGYSPEPSTIKCFCKPNGMCYLKLGGFKCVYTGEGGCFPRSAMLLQTSGAEVSVASVRAGSHVFGLNSRRHLRHLDSVTYIGDTHDDHPEARDDSLHSFLEIRHACAAGRPFRITAEHLVYVVDNADRSWRRLERAGSLRPGLDYLLAVGCGGQHNDSASKLGPSLVLNVSHVLAEGLYNPMTTSGTAVVDGVATSNAVLATHAISEAWATSPSIRRYAEEIAQVILFPPRVLQALGVPWSWLQTKRVHNFYMTSIEFLLRLGAWIDSS